MSTARYQCSIGVTLQPTIDIARRIVHDLGLRPYRVFLVWQQRKRDRTWEQVRRCELMPVTVVASREVDLANPVWGEEFRGGYRLKDISPSQVDGDILRGYLDGSDWAAKDSHREFFYEMQLHQRCTGDVLEPRVRRFIHSEEPFFDGNKFSWSIELMEQKVARSRSLEDQTIGTEFEDTDSLPFDRPTLVT